MGNPRQKTSGEFRERKYLEEDDKVTLTSRAEKFKGKSCRSIPMSGGPDEGSADNYRIPKSDNPGVKCEKPKPLEFTENMVKMNVENWGNS
jgi:hypothetical protein